MNFTISLNRKKIETISWSIVLLYMISVTGILSEEVLFLISVGVVLLMIGLSKRLIIPRVGGLAFYLIMIAIAIVLGLITYASRNVGRDVFYILPTVLMVVIGYYCYMVSGDSKPIVKTMVLCGLLNTIYVFLTFLADTSVLDDFSETRSVFNVGIYNITLIAIVLFVYIIDAEKSVFGKKADFFIMILFLAQIVMSFSRSVWVETVVGSAIVLVVKSFFEGRNIKFFLRVITIVVIAFVASMLLFMYAPEDIVQQYSEKIDRTEEEIDAGQSFMDVSQAMANWRGYENKMAITQWKKEGFITELIGDGMGKGVHIRYIPSNWTAGTVENNEIPILHSAYHTILPKCGLLGVIALVWFMGSQIILGFRNLFKDRKRRNLAIIIIAISVCFMLQAYAVRGPITKGINIVWGVVVGWINAAFRVENENEEEGEVTDE